MPTNDVISNAVRVIRNRSRLSRQHGYWEEVDRELRSYFIELKFSGPYRRSERPFDTWGMAKISRARELLEDAKSSLKEASKLPKLVSKFGTQVFGEAELLARPHGALKDFEKAVGLMAEHLARLERGLHLAIAPGRRTRGSRLTVLERATDTATTRFLQRLILLWRRAAGRRQLGEEFEKVARDLILAALGQAPDNLRRHITQAKNRGDEVPTDRTLMTVIENLPLSTMRRVRAR